MHDFNSDRPKKVQGVLDAILCFVEYFFYISKIDESFCALNARQMGDEDKFFDEAGGVTVDDRIFLRVEASAVSGLVPIAAVVQSSCISIVTDGQYFSEVGTRDDRTDS